MLNIRMDKVASVIEEVADEIIVPRFGKLLFNEIFFKKKDDPYTIADKEAEIALSTRLVDLLPGSKVLGEEAFFSDPSLSRHVASDSPVWIIDPVDGTKVFIEGKPFYGVIVALAEQNTTLAAWLYDPTSKEFVTAQKGAGAYFKGERLSVLPPDEIEKMSGLLGSRIVHAFNKKGISLDGGSKPAVQKMFSACHDYARLVVGKPHFSRCGGQVHFHSLLATCTPWDCAAGILIHEESGGYTAHWNGDPFLPSHFDLGVLSAPDKESWIALRDWIKSNCPLPD